MSVSGSPADRHNGLPYQLDGFASISLGSPLPFRSAAKEPTVIPGTITREFGGPDECAAARKAILVAQGDHKALVGGLGR